MGWDGELTLVDTEEILPYQRPPLSKKFLAGQETLSDTHFRPPAFYDDHDIELALGHRVIGIDRIARAVHLEGRGSLEYDHLVLATGARPRPLPVAGARAESVCHLHTADHSVKLRERIAASKRVVVIGGGFIGLEAASMVIHAGKEVVVLEAAARLMGRAVSEPISRYFHSLHAGAGVDVRLLSKVSSLQPVADRIELRLGLSSITADTVVVGVGVVPNDALAAQAGLATSDGVLVDAHLRTTDPNISAIGDCARFPRVIAGTQSGIRLESVQNASDHARHVAAFIAGEQVSPYDVVPWFWTEQHGRKLQMAGLTSGYDRTEKVETGPDKFSVYCYRGTELLGCESVNSPRDHAHARKQLTAARSFSAKPPPPVTV
ncbi:3-phenylpropionate/trans-cinnamate dioxygenase ferredoxin reductase subunit [Mycobacterium sp. AZCC_0083]|nr:3-phenylpropionate/trans-cinnamate dioxygenase ferredoxin reductase subunit [Mycobacterium sp. AZCC_0083]